MYESHYGENAVPDIYVRSDRYPDTDTIHPLQIGASYQHSGVLRQRVPLLAHSNQHQYHQDAPRVAQYDNNPSKGLNFRSLVTYGGGVANA